MYLSGGSPKRTRLQLSKNQVRPDTPKRRTTLCANPRMGAFLPCDVLASATLCYRKPNKHPASPTIVDGHTKPWSTTKIPAPTCSTERWPGLARTLTLRGRYPVAFSPRRPLCRQKKTKQTPYRAVNLRPQGRRAGRSSPRKGGTSR